MYLKLPLLVPRSTASLLHIHFETSERIDSKTTLQYQESKVPNTAQIITHMGQYVHPFHHGALRLGVSKTLSQSFHFLICHNVKFNLSACVLNFRILRSNLCVDFHIEHL